MTLQSSGPIRISNINSELGVSSTTNRSLGNSASRTLAGVPGGTIRLSNFYGKSNWSATYSGPSGSGEVTDGTEYSGGQYQGAGFTISANTTTTWTYSILAGETNGAFQTVSRSSGTSGNSIIFYMNAYAEGFQYYTTTTHWVVTATYSGGSKTFYVILSAYGDSIFQ